MTKKLAHVIIGVVMLAGLYALIYRYTPVNRSGVYELGGSAASSVADFNAPRSLIGFAQNVFAAKVLQEVSRIPRPSVPTPRVQYDTKVLYNIKGNISGEVIVDLEAEGGISLIPGATYLFAARHADAFGPWFYVSSHPAFFALISEDSNLSEGQVTELIKGHPRTYELLNAYPNEILLRADINHGITNNSFQSLSQTDKEEVYGKLTELIPPRPVPEISPSLPPPVDLRENFGSVCRDGMDNDGDKLVDKADPDCGGVLREDLPSLCRDNMENDLDGLIDAADPDCAQFYPPPPAPLPPPPPQPVHVTSTPPAPAPSSTPQ